MSHTKSLLEETARSDAAGIHTLFLPDIRNNVCHIASERLMFIDYSMVLTCIQMFCSAQ